MYTESYFFLNGSDVLDSRGTIYIKSGSSSSSVGYGDSSSSCCLFLAFSCIQFMASLKTVGLGDPSMRHFKMPLHLAPGNATGKPSDMGVSWQEPRPDLGTCETPMSMGELGDSPSSNRSSCLVTDEATPLARPPKLESLDLPYVGSLIGGMGVEPSAYAGGVCSPGVEVAILDAMGSNTSSRPSSLFNAASLVAASASFGVAYGWGMSGPGVLDWGWRCQCAYFVSSTNGVRMPVILDCSCLFRQACCRSGGSCLLLASALAHRSLSKASACRECSYRSSVAFSRSFGVVWHRCCHLNSIS